MWEDDEELLHDVHYSLRRALSMANNESSVPGETEEERRKVLCSPTSSKCDGPTFPKNSCLLLMVLGWLVRELNCG